MARRIGRKRSELPNCYYESYLEKSSTDGKTTQKLWTCLCGNSLFFFNDKRDNDYMEKLDLTGFVSIQSSDSNHDQNAAGFTLHMKNTTINFIASNLENRDLWKAFIQSIAQLSVPASLNLLPGQIHMLKEAVEQEEERLLDLKTSQSSGTYVTIHCDFPGCYYPISRSEACALLERESLKGNMLLRPSRDGNSYAVTTRQELDGAVYKHYRVTRKSEGGFVIDLTDPVRCVSLHGVINHLVEQTDGVLIPLIIEGQYDKNVSYVFADQESGEKTEQVLLKPPTLPKRSFLKKFSSLSDQILGSSKEEQLYLNERETNEIKSEESSAAPPSSGDGGLRKILMPPMNKFRKTSCPTPPPSSATFHMEESESRATPPYQKGLPQAAISELKLKLNRLSMPQT